MSLSDASNLTDDELRFQIDDQYAQPIVVASIACIDLAVSRRIIV